MITFLYDECFGLMFGLAVIILFVDMFNAFR